MKVFIARTLNYSMLEDLLLSNKMQTINSIEQNFSLWVILVSNVLHVREKQQFQRYNSPF